MMDERASASLESRAREVVERRLKHVDFDALIADDRLLVYALRQLTPWQGDRYGEIAYLHTRAVERIMEQGDDARKTSSIHEALIDSVEDWVEVVNGESLDILSESLSSLNGYLLHRFGVGSRWLVGTTLLLDAIRPNQAARFAEWHRGRYGFPDIVRAIDESEACGIDPVLTLMGVPENRQRWVGGSVGDGAERPPVDWYWFHDGEPEYAEPPYRSLTEVDSRMPVEARRAILSALRGAQRDVVSG